MGAKYRKLIKRFWIDPKTLDLTDRQKLVLIYAITGIEACTHTNASGIYEITRARFQNVFDYPLNEVSEVLDFFNRKKSCLLEYDAENHIIFVKSFFKHNGTYKKCITSLMQDFDETFDKAPRFWAEFFQKYRKKLWKMLEDEKLNLTEEQRKFIIDGFALKDSL